MARKAISFRVGRVRGDLRGRTWYLTYFEDGRRVRPRVGSSRDLAKQYAAKINAELEIGTPASLSFESISIEKLRDQWLDHHEYVSRSSLATIRRYRAATAHLIGFLDCEGCPRTTAAFRIEHAESFARYLRTIRVPPNGHPNTPPRPLLDKGVRFILQVCRSLFHYAVRHRHLPPYTDNPFSAMQLDRIPLEDSKPVVLFTPDQERQFIRRCDNWQFPIFSTLMLTGLRPGELVHLLLPYDIEHRNWPNLVIRNRPKLGWQVKTRRDRVLPIHPILAAVLCRAASRRTYGTMFQGRKAGGRGSEFNGYSEQHLEAEVQQRLAAADSDNPLDRVGRLQICRTLWRDLGAVKTDRIRIEFAKICRQLGMGKVATPKMLRHLFATSLQDANVDPLIRNELMGHKPARDARGAGLGMTAVYTHTRPETMREQLCASVERRTCYQAICDRLRTSGA